VGKTTIAFSLAVMRASLAGVPVLLVDADKQASASLWASLRTEAEYEPPLICVQKTGKIGYDLARLAEKFEVIVDAGGQDSVELRQAIAVANQWIIPVQPAQLDLFVLAKMAQLRVDILERTGVAPETSIVLNRVSPFTKEGDQAREMLLDDEKFPRVMDSQLADRAAMRKAVAAGCCVTELPGKQGGEAATAELRALYDEVFGVEVAQ
jgi:chromosome partitioning protein